MTLSGPPGSAKTLFALQKSVTVAAHGGLAIYFSLEESRKLLVDRLTSFSLLDNERFLVAEAGNDILTKIEQHLDQDDDRGLLILYGLDRSSPKPIVSVLEQISQFFRDIRHRDAPLSQQASKLKWRAIIIDSINALLFQNNLKSDAGGDSRDDLLSRSRFRQQIQHLVSSIEEQRFFGLLLSEEGSQLTELLEYLSDSVISMGFDESRQRRWIEISKSRGQNFHPGKHPFRVIEGRGVKIYPSLAAIRTTLRKRSRGSFSEDRCLSLTHTPYLALRKSQIPEESLCLITGGRASGKSLLALRLAVAQAARMTTDGLPLRPPTGVLWITFRTPPARFEQLLASEPEIQSQWRTVKNTVLRWFSPGRSITPDQVAADVWKTVQESRRESKPIERIVFDEIDSIYFNLPQVENENLFWPTITELLRTESLTGIFVHDDAIKKSSFLEFMGSEVDYIMRVAPAARPGLKSDDVRIEVQRFGHYPGPRGKARTRGES